MCGIRFTGVVLGWTLATVVQAEPAVDPVLKHRPQMPVVSVVQGSDGSVVKRLDLSVLPTMTHGNSLPASSEEWLARMIDPMFQGLVVKQPELFAAWLDAVTEPRFMTALATVALDPSAYPRALKRVADPATVRSWAEMFDPNVYMRWMAAGLDPKLYISIFQRMANPNKYLRWVMLGMTVRDTHPYSGYSSLATELTTSNGQAWLQLSEPDAKTNPWLAGTGAKRY
jgi:hypothetical protein